MSRTDKTDPWWVRRAETPLSATAVHRHFAGDCDLPEVTRADPGRTACYWAPGPHLLYGRGRGCGCRICTDFYARRDERRSNRHESSSEMQALVRLVRRLDAVEPDLLIEIDAR
jgi:hypothetical protein